MDYQPEHNSHKRAFTAGLFGTFGVLTSLVLVAAVVVAGLLIYRSVTRPSPIVYPRPDPVVVRLQGELEQNELKASTLEHIQKMQQEGRGSPHTKPILDSDIQKLRDRNDAIRREIKKRQR